MPRRKGPEHSWFLDKISWRSRKQEVYHEAKEAESLRHLNYQALSDGISWQLLQSALKVEEKPSCNLQTFLVNCLKRCQKKDTRPNLKALIISVIYFLLLSKYSLYSLLRRASGFWRLLVWAPRSFAFSFPSDHLRTGGGGQLYSSSLYLSLSFFLFIYLILASFHFLLHHILLYPHLLWLVLHGQITSLGSQWKKRDGENCPRSQGSLPYKCLIQSWGSFLKEERETSPSFPSSHLWGIHSFKRFPDVSHPDMSREIKEGQHIF